MASGESPTSAASSARCSTFPPAEAERFYGISPIVRNVLHADVWETGEESAATWWDTVAPVIVHDVPPGDPDFESVFGGLAKLASGLDPATNPTLLIPLRQSFPGLDRMHHNWLGDIDFLYERLHNESGSLVGVLALSKVAVSSTLAARLARGDVEMFERMSRLSLPERRPAAILFADLEASGDLSRRLSSRAYFGLIRSLTDLINGSVVASGGSSASTPAMADRRCSSPRQAPSRKPPATRSRRRGRSGPVPVI